MLRAILFGRAVKFLYGLIAFARLLRFAFRLRLFAVAVILGHHVLDVLGVEFVAAACPNAFKGLGHMGVMGVDDRLLRFLPVSTLRHVVYVLLKCIHSLVWNMPCAINEVVANVVIDLRIPLPETRALRHSNTSTRVPRKMIGRLLRKSRWVPIPYHDDLGTPLLKFGRRDTFTIRDACEGVQILGGTGSGKTSGSGRALAHAYLKAGMGGMVCCAKPDEADLWRKLARECGREQDLVFFDATAAHRFNFMDYAQATIGQGGFDTNLVHLVAQITEAARKQGGGGSGKDDQYFRDAANQLLSHALPFLRVAYGSIRLRELYRFINDAPTSRQEALDPAFVKRSFCGATMFAVGDKARAGDREAKRIADEYGDYWTAEFPNIADRQRAAVVSTLTSTIYPFMAGQLHRLFCTDTTLAPELSRAGLIIVLDLPARQFGAAGIVAQQIFKLLWQQSMERQKVTADTRPVFAWMDECQFFMNSADAEHLSVCRQQRVCNVFLTQDLPTYYARIGDEHEAESLLNKFGTRIFHATTDARTGQYAAEIIGKVTHYQASDSVTRTATTGGGHNLGNEGSHGSGNDSAAQAKGRTRSTYQDYDIAPDYLGRELRTGGPEHKYRVDAIIVRKGVFRSSKRNRIKAEFRQQ